MTQLRMIFPMLYELYTQPLFLLHLALYWNLCMLCFIYDTSLSANSKLEDQGKYNRAEGRRFRIDWLIYFQAIWYSLHAQFFLLAPCMWVTEGLSSWSGLGELEGSFWSYQGLRKLMFCALLEETLFYYAHRLLHLPEFWKYHSLHHQLKAPVAVGAFYASSLENLFCNIIPVLLAPLLVGLPGGLLPVWTVIATLAPVLSHSGFRLLEPFAKFHALHHLTKAGNYSVFGLLDKLHGTYIVEEEPLARV